LSQIEQNKAIQKRKPLNQCKDRKEYDYQYTRSWCEANNIDYDLLTYRPDKAKKSGVNTTVNIENSKSVNVTHKQYRKWYMNAKNNYQTFLDTGKNTPLNTSRKWQKLLTENNYKCVETDSKLIIDNYKNPTL